MNKSTPSPCRGNRRLSYNPGAAEMLKPNSVIIHADNGNNAISRMINGQRSGEFQAGIEAKINIMSKRSSNSGEGLSRRRFIAKTAAAAAGAVALPLLAEHVWAADGGTPLAIVLAPNDAVAQAAPSRWATGYLQDALNARGVSAKIYDALEQVPAGQECIVAAGRGSALALAGGINLPDAPEGLGLAHATIGQSKVLLAVGADTRGLVYALLDLADRVTLGEKPMAALRGVESSVERPANRIRSVTRLLVSEVEDKAWYHDRAFWRDYLTMLAAQRFNRFNLALGIGYDGPSGLRDGYFYFAYPFLVSVPGYDVKVARLPDKEPAANLEMLKFISDEAALRGLHFQLGVWTHAYKWPDGPGVNYVIKGLTDDKQAEYSRDALRTVLEACPAIKGVTIRIHGESGVPEGSYDFWKTVFDGMVRTGRSLELDLHAKGMDQKTIDIALATGLPVNISPKVWGEHMGLPYMQAAIRSLEMPARNAQDHGFYSLSSGSRSFLRYSYGDLLAEDRKYQMLHRIWPGTQRMLLWGDPTMAAALGRNWSFCGTDGFEFMEPLSFKGRKASGLPGGRDGYADATLSTGGSGWEKILYTYRVWGRLAYNPDAKPDTWQRMLRKQFGPGAESAEAALSSAGRLLPIITSAHAPSAGNNNYWPEMYLNQPIMTETRRGLYGDSPTPRRFGYCQPDGPADVPDGRTICRRIDPGKAKRQIFARGRRVLAGNAGAGRERTSGRRGEGGATARDTGVPADGGGRGHPERDGPFLRVEIPRGSFICVVRKQRASASAGAGGDGVRQGADCMGRIGGPFKGRLCGGRHVRSGAGIAGELGGPAGGD